MNGQGGISFFGSTNMPISTHLRFLNAIRVPEYVSLYIDGQKYFTDVPFATATGYTSVPPGIYTVSVYKFGDYGTPMAQINESFSVGSSFTLAGVGAPGAIRLYQIPEPYSVQISGYRASLRIVNLSNNKLTLDAWLNNNIKPFSNIRYTEITPYTRLQSNVYTVTLKEADTDNIVAVAESLYLAPSKIYSLYVVPSKDDSDQFLTILTTDGEIPSSDIYVH